MRGTDMSHLAIRGASKNFRGLRAVDHFDVETKEGEILGLIGPNGAGKTTLFNLITNNLPLTEGEIYWKGENITGLRTDLIAKRGILRTFQIPRIFTHIDVYQNLLIGSHKNCGSGVFDAFLQNGTYREDERIARQKAGEILQLFGMDSQRNVLAANLPYGQMKRLAIAIVMTAEPEMLLLDEPAAGVNPNEKMALIDLIYKIRDMGVSICLVDHDMRFIMEVCDRVVVLNYGKKIAEGRPEEIQGNDEVIEAYLGRRKIA